MGTKDRDRKSATEAQEATMDAVHDEWLGVGLSTEEIDKSRAERAIMSLRFSMGVTKQPEFLWFDSPSSAVAALRRLVANKCTGVSLDPKERFGRDGGKGWIIRRLSDVHGRAWKRSEGYLEKTRFPNYNITNRVFESLRRSLSMGVVRCLKDTINESGVRGNCRHPIMKSDLILSIASIEAYAGIVPGFRLSDADVKTLKMYKELARATEGWWNYGEYVLLWKRPVEIHSESARWLRTMQLHNLNGPAIKYADGLSVFTVHGTRVPAFVIENPELITVKIIEDELNAEVRRVMIDRYPGGAAQYLVDSGAEEIHRDDWGILYRKDLKNLNGKNPMASGRWIDQWHDEEPIVMVKVVNSTPEPDGSFKDYWLRVPPDMETARQAVAWTFGHEENTYSPVAQT